ncbi:MAG: hemolysin family protein [Bacteroidales bacterium]|nr:hemolysin family protein [Bacteroidales bacterium]
MIRLLVIFILILLNGFFSMSEIAIVSFKKVRIDKYASRHAKGVATAHKLQEKQEEFLASVQVCITLIGLLTGFVGGAALAVYLEPLFLLTGMGVAAAKSISIVLSIAVITFFTIVLGELVPKTIGLSKPERVAIAVAPFMNFVRKLFKPAVKLLSKTTSLIDKMLGVKVNGEEHLTEDELLDIIKEAGETDVIEEEQSELHENIFQFSDKRAIHIMTHRSEIEWIDVNLEHEAFISQLYDFSFSKILVCDKHVENYLGVLNVKDFFMELHHNEDLNVRTMLDTPLVFSENTDAQDILTQFRKSQYYFGIVVDEFGELAGIVTMHDILENIVGDVPEEEEVVEPDVVACDDGSFLVRGDADIDVLTDVIDDYEVDYDEIDYSTVAGFAVDHLESIPKEGDSFEFMGYTIEISKMDHNRIDFVKVKKTTDGC